MVAVDSSSLIAYLNGETAPDTELVDRILQDAILVLPPVVLVEVLGFPDIPVRFARVVQRIPLLPISEGHWARAAGYRADLLASDRKARLGDTLIATSCIDHDTLLVTRDPDFRHFERFGLRLAGAQGSE